MRLTIITIFLTTIFSLSVLSVGTQPVFAQTDGKLVECSTADDCTYAAFTKTFENIVDLLLAAAVAISTIIFAYAGFLFLTSGENPGNRQRAKNLIWSAVVGFFIAAAAWLLVEVFLNTIGAKQSVVDVNEFNLQN